MSYIIIIIFLKFAHFIYIYSDLWLSSSSCTRCASQTTGGLFTPSDSSTFQTVQGNLDVTYGSGQAVGSLGSDTVSFGGFQVGGQVFGVATQVTNSFLTGNLSGLMGLGFQNLASTGAQPWWIASSSSWTKPQMSFYLTRYVFTNNNFNESCVLTCRLQIPKRARRYKCR